MNVLMFIWIIKQETSEESIFLTWMMGMMFLTQEVKICEYSLKHYNLLNSILVFESCVALSEAVFRLVNFM